MWCGGRAGSWSDCCRKGGLAQPVNERIGYVIRRELGRGSGPHGRLTMQVFWIVFLGTNELSCLGFGILYLWM